MPAARTSPGACRCLRTKGMYVPRFGETPSLAEASATAVFWCTKTMKVTGPDGIYVAPEACRSARACFESQEGGVRDGEERKA